MSRAKRLGAEIAWICFGQLLIVTGGIFGVRLLTYKLAPSIYGDLSIGITAAFLAHQIFFIPLGQSFLRYYSPACEEGRMNIFLRTVNVLMGKVSILIFVISFISISVLFLTKNIHWMALIFFAFLYSLITGYTTILSYIQNAARQRKIVALHQGVGQWMHFLVPVGLILIFGPYSSITMCGYLLASLLVLFSQLKFFWGGIVFSPLNKKTVIAPQVLKKYIKKVLAYAWPFSLWGLFAWAQFSSSRWALLSHVTAKDVGFYSVLYQFGYYPIIVVSTLVSQVATPIFFGRAGSGKDSSRVAKTIELNSFLILITGIATIVFVAISFMFHREIFSLIVSPEYREISYLLPLLVLSGGIFAIGQMINIVFLIKADTQMLIIPKIVTAVAGVVLNYAGAYFYGLIGVVVAGIAFPLVYLVWVLILRATAKREMEKGALVEKESVCFAS